MYILPQEYESEYIKGLENYLHDLLYPIQTIGKRVNFVNLIEAVCYNVENLARKTIVAYLEKLDKDFKESKLRKDRYYVKDYRARTLVTMFGEITYSRTIYVDKDSNERYVYVDEKMGIDKYIRYANDVRSYAYEAYADENSMIKVGKELGSLIHCKFSLKKNDEYYLSRQTIFNFLKMKPVHYSPESKKEAERIFLLLDEKYIGCQDLGKKIMSKVCLIYEDVVKSNRNKLLNKTYLSSSSNEFKYDLLTYLDEIYDLDSLKEIYFMSDGGTWIKEVFNEIRLPNVNCIKCLDEFHGNRALSNIVEDYNARSIVQYYIQRKDLESFKKSIKHFVTDESDQADYKYLINNFKELSNMYHSPGPCAMEQVISHHIASEFSSVPKAYSSKNIDRYLSMRDNYRNGINMKELFLQAKENDNKEIEIIPVNKTQLNFSIFDKKSDIPYYDTTNINGKLLFTPF